MVNKRTSCGGVRRDVRRRCSLTRDHFILMRINNKSGETGVNNGGITVFLGCISALSVQEHSSGSSGHSPVKVQLQQDKPPG